MYFDYPLSNKELYIIIVLIFPTCIFFLYVFILICFYSYSTFLSASSSGILLIFLICNAAITP